MSILTEAKMSIRVPDHDHPLFPEYFTVHQFVETLRRLRLASAGDVAMVNGEYVPTKNIPLEYGRYRVKRDTQMERA